MFKTFVFLAFYKVFAANQTPTVETLVIEQQKVQRLVKYPAIISPTVQGKLTSEINGTVTRIVKNLGTKVKSNEPVFYIKNNQIGMNFHEYAVRSPVSGIISKLDIHVGKNVTVGESGGEVVDPTKYKFLSEAPAADTRKIQIGYIAEFEFEGQKIKAKVSALSPVVNPQTGTAQMELIPLLPTSTLTIGSVGKMSIFLPEEQHITIPPESLIKLNLKKFVRKLEKNDTVKMTEVETGDIVNGQQIITKGLNTKDEIVVKTSDFVKDGDKVVRSQPQSLTK